MFNMNRFVLFFWLVTFAHGAVPIKKGILSNILKTHDRSDKITGGTKIDIEQVPWLLAFEVGDTTVCQAAIINEKWAVTAGHCSLKMPGQEIVLRAGSSVAHTGGTIHQVVNITTHDKFDGNNLDYDVAVLEVSQPFVWGPSTQPIKLASTEPAGGDDVSVAGWGALDQAGSHLPDDLQSVTLPVLDRDDCQDAWAFFLDVVDRFVCTLAEGKGPCAGDAGAPLVQNGTLVGVNLVGMRCGAYYMPAVYINTANQEIQDFIDANTQITK